MQEQTPNGDLELVDNAGGHWDKAKRWEDEPDEICTLKDHHVSLRPPCLFRSIGGFTGTSANLPPHRRLRSIFHRSRAILPADMEKQALGIMQTTLDVKTRKKTLSETSRLTQTGEIAQVGILTLVAAEPQTVMVTQSNSGAGLSQSTSTADSLTEWNPCFRLAPPAWIHSEGKERQSRDVPPLGQKIDPRRRKGESRLQAARRKQGKKKNGVETICPALQAPEDGELSQWLQTLEIVDRERNTHLASNNSSQRGRNQATIQPGVGRRKAALQGTELSDTETGQRRDRRPHFLPPITQSGSLLGVPLLLPENSPPPSPCFSSSTPFAPLLVPQLRLFSPKRKTNTDVLISKHDVFP